jgi:hypothetical protein
VNIPTPPFMWKTKRILDRQHKEALAVLDAMQNGAVLFALGHDEWLVSTTGQIVGRTVAGIVTHDRHVVGQGDGLFEDCPQSWRWSE